MNGYCLLALLSIDSLVYITQDHLPMSGTIHSQLDPHQPLIKKTPQLANLMEGFLNWSFPRWT